jgi:hypothetical protein
MVDQRAEKYSGQRLLRNNGLPNKLDLRTSLPIVQDQGMRSTCLAFAVTAGHENIRFIKDRVIEDLSEELLYWRCKQIDGDKEPGTVFTSAAVALMKWGQPPEEVWFYDGYCDDTDVSYTPPSDALDSTLCYRAQMRKIDTTIQEIQIWLARGYAVTLGMLLSRDFYFPIEGVISIPISRDELYRRACCISSGL